MRFNSLTTACTVAVFPVPGTPEMSIYASNEDGAHRQCAKKKDAQIHPPLPSSSNSSTARITRAYSSARQGSASGRAPTCSACIARNQGSFSVDTSPSANAPTISGGGGASMTGRRARARIARLECGVGAAASCATRLRRGVVGAARRRLLEGVRGASSLSSLSEEEDDTPPPSDLPWYSTSLTAGSGSSSATLRRRFETGWTATTHGAPEPHSTSSVLARLRACSRWSRQSSS
jgi:hypothetical protein